MCYTLASRCASLAEILLFPRSGKRLRLAQAGLTAVLLIATATVGRAAPILYVSAGVGNSRIYAIEPGQPDRQFSTGQQASRGLTLGPDGLLYAGDTGGFNRIRSFDRSTGAPVRSYGRDLFEFSFEAYDMQFGADSQLYIATPFAPTSVTKLNVQTGVATPFVTGFRFVFGLTFGPDGDLYLGGQDPDTSVGQIRRYDGDTGELISVFATHPELNFPHGLEFGPDGNLYVTEGVLTGEGSEVLRFNGSTGAFMDVFASLPDRDWPYDVKFGPHDGNLYLSTLQGIVKFDGSTGDFLEVYSDPQSVLYYMAFAPVPEPSTAALLLVATASTGCWGLSRRRKAGRRTKSDGACHCNVARRLH